MAILPLIAWYDIIDVDGYFPYDILAFDCKDFVYSKNISIDSKCRIKIIISWQIKKFK